LCIRKSGITEPIKANSSENNVGVGKQQEYDNIVVEVTKDRKRMDIEIDQTSDVKRQRLENAEKESALNSDLKTMNKEFYCELCDKQYKNVQEMANHLDSNDHYHKKNFKEMKQSTADLFNPSESRDAIRKREEVQMEREIKKRQKLMKSVAPSSVAAGKEFGKDKNCAEINTICESEIGVRSSSVSLDAPGNNIPQEENNNKPVKVSFSMGFKMNKKK
jgi:hypothetical protein